MTAPARRRRTGLLIPLFSAASSTSWGIGDIGDLAPVSAWLADAGCRVLQLLPLNEMAPGQHSPYSALSAMAIDPIFIRLPDVEEFRAAGGERSLPCAARQALEGVRASPRVDYPSVRQLKQAALALAFDRFYDVEWSGDSARARAFREFVTRQAWWIEDYALFRAIHAHQGERPWTEWPEPLRRREPPAIDRVRRDLSRDVIFYQYLQWLAAAQWQDARRTAATRGVAIFGDLPFMVDSDSADVWARQHQFQLEVSLGVPPDAFSASGQDWGMPVYRWNTIAAEDFRWLRDRARRGADLYDGLRADHVVGYYRTFGRPRDGSEPFFTPESEAEQVALGERILAIFREPGAAIIAEDLGTVPDYVRDSLARIEMPGFRVFRWERFWHRDGQPFRDPLDYPAASVATTGTHDTESLAAWWDRADADERRAVAAIPSVRQIDAGLGDRAFDGSVRDVLLEALAASGSDLLMLPLPDVFGWRDRVNEPATINERNWTYQLPWPVDRLTDVPEAEERQRFLRRLAEQYRRYNPLS
jgi:4-alpha-glucanotransferase